MVAGKQTAHRALAHNSLLLLTPQQYGADDMSCSSSNEGEFLSFFTVMVKG